MIFDWSATAALAAVQNTQPEAPLTLSGEGLWVCLVSSGTCTASLDDIGPSPAGSALILPPQNAPAGHLILSRSPLTLTPAGACHLLCLQLTGQAALQFLAGLPGLPFLARGETCPAAAGPAANWPLPCSVSFPGPTAPPPPCPRWCRRPWRTSGQTMPAFTAWKNSVSGWVSPKAIWYGCSPPRWGYRRAAT